MWSSGAMGISIGVTGRMTSSMDGANSLGRKAYTRVSSPMASRKDTGSNFSPRAIGSRENTEEDFFMAMGSTPGRMAQSTRASFGSMRWRGEASGSRLGETPTRAATRGVSSMGTGSTIGGMVGLFKGSLSTAACCQKSHLGTLFRCKNRSASIRVRQTRAQGRSGGQSRGTDFTQSKISAAPARGTYPGVGTTEQ